MTNTDFRDDQPRLRIIQNCYEPEQIEACIFEPYLNTHTPTSGERYLFFESDVIARLVSEGWHQDCEYFGGLSHRWQSKLRETQALPLPLKNLNRQPITLQALEAFVSAESQVDIVSLACHIPQAVFRLGDSIHPGLMAATKQILAHTGIRFDLSRTVKRPIYCNAFIAKRRFIECYVRDLLETAIQAAQEDSALRTMLFADAGYFRPFPPGLADAYGINHYPLHAFVGERLINVYVMLTGARVRPLRLGNPHSLQERAAQALEIQARRIQWKLAPLERRLKSLPPIVRPIRGGGEEG